MSDGKIVFTLKAGRDFDAPWIVISGDTVSEANGLLGDLERSNSFAEVVTAAELFKGAGTAASLAVPQPAAAPPSAAASTPTAPPATPGPSAEPQFFCAHGPRRKHQGRSARGAWTGYFCSLPKGDPGQCKPLDENGQPWK